MQNHRQDMLLCIRNAKEVIVEHDDIVLSSRAIPSNHTETFRLPRVNFQPMTTSSNYSRMTDLILTTRDVCDSMMFLHAITIATLPLLPWFIIAKASMNSIGETFLLAEKAIAKEAYLFAWRSHKGVKSLHLKFPTLQAGPLQVSILSHTFSSAE